MNFINFCFLFIGEIQSGKIVRRERVSLRLSPWRSRLRSLRSIETSALRVSQPWHRQQKNESSCNRNWFCKSVLVHKRFLLGIESIYVAKFGIPSPISE